MASSPTRARAGRATKARGRSWESYLEGLFGLLCRSGVCHAIRTPEPMRRLQPQGEGRWICVPESKGPPDYVICYQGRGLALEAKQTTSTRWSFGDLRQHQAQHLEAWQRAGGVSGLLLSIEGLQLALPWTRIGPLWWGWSQADGRAAAGTASIPAARLRTMGVELDLAGAWLGWLCDPTPLREVPRLPQEDPLTCQPSMF